MQSKKAHKALLELYNCSYNGQQQPSKIGLKTTLQSMLRDPFKTYIIIDALDECTDRKELLELIQEINGWKISKVQILVTSRREPDIEYALELLLADQICIQSAQTNSDIQLHIQEQLQVDLKLSRWPQKVQEEIEETLMNGAHGM